MEFYEYPDGSGYEGRFTRCGICVLMKELGLYDLPPRFVSSGLHHERSGRRDEFCAAVHPCRRRTLLRLRVPKEGQEIGETPDPHLPKIDKVFSILVYSPRRCVIS